MVKEKWIILIFFLTFLFVGLLGEPVVNSQTLRGDGGNTKSVPSQRVLVIPFKCLQDDPRAKLYAQGVYMELMVRLAEVPGVELYPHEDVVTNLQEVLEHRELVDKVRELKDYEPLVSGYASVLPVDTIITGLCSVEETVTDPILLKMLALQPDYKGKRLTIMGVRAYHCERVNGRLVMFNISNFTKANILDSKYLPHEAQDTGADIITDVSKWIRQEKEMGLEALDRLIQQEELALTTEKDQSVKKKLQSNLNSYELMKLDMGDPWYFIDQSRVGKEPETIPEEPFGHLIAGSLEMSLEKRLELLTKAIDGGVQSSTAYMLRGRTYFAINDASKGFQDLDAAVRLEPQRYTVYLLRSMMYYGFGQSDAALKDAAKALELQPSSIKTRVVLVQIHFHRREYVKALEKIEGAIRLQPDNPTLYHYRMVIRYELGEYREALADLQTCRSLGLSITEESEQLIRSKLE